ncbi:hypothetical protein ACIBTV_26845 [Micromonospora sp. NPDC049366]|uniref:hypothetical protein n=1 Tax=Micromonospora sp. NPDC049366 TaxID=3364271 RepID=UPI0037A8768B
MGSPFNPGVPVRDLRLTRRDDGLQELRIELDDEQGPVVLTWTGHLSISPQEPLSGQHVQWDLIMSCRQGGVGDPWATLQVLPPRPVVDLKPIMGRP